MEFYYWLTAEDQILMLVTYAKAVRDNLTPVQVEALRSLVKDL